MDASPFGFECFVMFDGWEFTTARRYAKRRAGIVEDLSIADCGLLILNPPPRIAGCGTAIGIFFNLQSAIRTSMCYHSGRAEDSRLAPPGALFPGIFPPGLFLA